MGGGGYHSQVRIGYHPPEMGYTPSREGVSPSRDGVPPIQRWGTPSHPGMGYPHPEMGYPSHPHPEMGYPHPRMGYPPDRTADGVLDTRWAVFLLPSRRRTFLFLKSDQPQNSLALHNLQHVNGQCVCRSMGRF